MAKQEQKTEQALPITPKEKSLPNLGDIVYFYKPEQTAKGVETKQFAAMVIDFPAGSSNYQKKDMAVTLKIFTSARGGADEIKEAMHAETKTAGRWSFKD